MRQLRAADVLDHLTSGVSASMLARRWNSVELVTLDITAMEALLANDELLESLEQLELFRKITDDLTAMISSNRELRNKQLANDDLTRDEKQRKRDATDRRDNLKKRLRRFLTRIPAFMYLTDDRERTIKDIIEQIEPDLFVHVTGLTLGHFRQLVDAGVFDDAKMNDAVWKFRQFEQPSLGYDHDTAAPTSRGGWSLTRDERFAALVDAGMLTAGDELAGDDGTVAVVTDDYGLAVGGVRLHSPDAAAAAVTDEDDRPDVDGWAFWTAETGDGPVTLADLAGRLEATTTA